MDSQSRSLLDFFDPSALPYAILLLVATAVLVKLFSIGAARFAERVAHRRLIIQQVSTLAGFAAWFFAAIVALNSVFRLSSEALLALSGTIAVAAGLALKDVASSFMAGLSILTTKPFQVGDRISFGGYYGEVREIGLRSVRIMTLDDNLVTVPTNQFLTEAVASANAGALECMVVIDLYLAGTEDHRRALEIVHDAVQASKYLYLDKPFNVLVAAQLSAQGRAVTVITAKAYVYDTRYERSFASDVTDRALAAFREEGIKVAGSDAD